MQSKTILDPSNQHLLTHLQVTQHSSNTHPYEILRYIVTSNPYQPHSKQGQLVECSIPHSVIGSYDKW
jgi:hypothetical protein